MADRPTLLGIPLDSVTMPEALARMQSMLASGGQHHVMTPNSEMLVEASKNKRFADVLRGSALNLPDSQGVVWFGRLPERVPGVDVVARLCASLDERHPVFLLGGAEGVAWRAAAILRAQNPSLKVVGTHAGSPRPEDASEILRRINEAQPHLLLVAFGAPQQDLWIAEHLAQMPSVRVAMGVGGTFDFLAGVRKRAPRWMQSLGLEWLWRFVQEPSRWRRMWRAVIVFPALVITKRA